MYIKKDNDICVQQKILEAGQDGSEVGGCLPPPPRTKLEIKIKRETAT